MSSKKSFKGNNPAMQFISTEQTEQTPNTLYTDKTYNTKLTYSNESKIDKISPADMTDDTDITDNTEIKSRRVNWLLFPSIFEDLKKIATMKLTTINDLVNKILKDYNAREAETINQYDAVFNKTS
jgi:ribosome biogenesis GTPase A